MGISTTIRSKLQSQVFARLGTTVSITPFSSSSTDKWGDATITYGSASNATGVPYNYAKDILGYFPFGDLQDGQLDMALPYDTTITRDDKVTYDSKDYKVIELEHFVIAGDVVAKIVRLQEDFSSTIP